MKYLDTVDSEGGPLLLADVTLARKWHGEDEEGEEDSDYARACEITDADGQGGSISIGQSNGIIWDMEGAGTADVLLEKPTYLKIVRAWLDEPEDSDTITQLAELPLQEAVELGSIQITSGVLVILAAVEDGSTLEMPTLVEVARPTGEMTSEASGLLIRLPEGHYTCFHDEVEMGEQSARRCHVIKAN